MRLSNTSFPKEKICELLTIFRELENGNLPSPETIAETKRDLIGDLSDFVAVDFIIGVNSKNLKSFYEIAHELNIEEEDVEDIYTYLYEQEIDLLPLEDYSRAIERTSQRNF